MKPEEKAKELVSKYKNAPFNCIDCEMLFCEIKCTMLSNEEAKECALIAVDEILNVIKSDIFSEYQYWLEVKQEIEKL